jgi:hypothetical protein
MDQAHELFEQFRTGGLPLLQQAIDEGWDESLWLEFKGTGPDDTVTASDGSLTRDGRRFLAEVISGFGNAQGGLAVWGIDCRRDPDTRIDAASALVSIPGLRRFIADLRSQSFQVVSPAVDGVEHIPVEDPAAPDSGFVLTFVPKAEGNPIMARAQGQHRFYKRSGAQFLPMEEYELADRYARRPQPKLELAWRLASGGDSSAGCLIRILVGIRNVGRGLAVYPAILLRPNPGITLDPSPLGTGSDPGLPERPAVEGGRLFAGGINDVIHPGTILWIARTTEVTVPHSTLVVQPRTISYELFCEGDYQQGEVQIEQEDFREIWERLRSFSSFWTG